MPERFELLKVTSDDSLSPCPDGGLLNLARMGYFRTLLSQMGEGGGSFRLSLAICQTTGPILDPKTAFDKPGHELLEYITNCCLKVTELKYQAKSQILNCHRWLRRATQPCEIEIKR